MWDSHLGQQLIWAERGFIVAGNQFLYGDLPLTMQAACNCPGIESTEHCWWVRCIIGIGKHTAYRRLVTYTWAGNQREGVCEDGPVLPDKGRTLHRSVRCHSANP